MNFGKNLSSDIPLEITETIVMLKIHFEKFRVSEQIVEDFIDLGNTMFFTELLADSALNELETQTIENPKVLESLEFSVTQMEDTSVQDAQINYNNTTLASSEFDTNNIDNFSGMFMFWGVVVF